MGNVATVVGALTAGILGGSLFAAALVARPRLMTPNTTAMQPGSQTVVAPPAPGGVVTGPRRPGRRRTADCRNPVRPSSPASAGAQGDHDEVPPVRRGTCAAGPAARRGADPAARADAGQVRGRDPRGHGADGRRRHLHLLDLRRHRPRPDAARPPGRHRRADADERAGQQGHPQHRPARRDRPGRRRQGDAGRARRVGHVPLQGAQPGRLRLPLRHADGRRTTSPAACTA